MQQRTKPTNDDLYNKSLAANRLYIYVLSCFSSPFRPGPGHAYFNCIKKPPLINQREKIIVRKGENSFIIRRGSAALSKYARMVEIRRLD